MEKESINLETQYNETYVSAFNVLLGINSLNVHSVLFIPIYCFLFIWLFL